MNCHFLSTDIYETTSFCHNKAYYIQLNKEKAMKNNIKCNGKSYPNDISFIRIKDLNKIKNTLLEFNDGLPPLQGEEAYVDSVSEKIAANGIVYCILANMKRIGFFSIYANDHTTKTAFISFIAIGRQYRNSGYGSSLLNKAILTAKENHMETLKLEVLKYNTNAQHFYKKHGFSFAGESENSIYLEKAI